MIRKRLIYITLLIFISEYVFSLAPQGLVKIRKNREKKEYSFANINLLGKCNAGCYFCLGQDIPEFYQGKNQMHVHFSEWRNFQEFTAQCKKYNIKKIYMTGQTADGLQYKYLSELIDYLQAEGFEVGVRTNGYLAEKKLGCIKKMKGEIGYSINSLIPENNEKIMRRKGIPDWAKIIPQSGENVRVSIVVNRYNIDEFLDICRFVSQFPNVKYIQARRVATDTREEELGPDIQLYEELHERIKKEFKHTGTFYTAEQYEIYGKEVDFWRTVETSVNGMNYFTDGTMVGYFIVEGYVKAHAPGKSA